MTSAAAATDKPRRSPATPDIRAASRAATAAPKAKVAAHRMVWMPTFKDKACIR